jgi:hypothetical protein
MARRNVTVTITAEGRDIGKAFLITELSASQAEEWGARTMNCISKATGGIDEKMLEAGLSGLTAVMVSAFARSNWSEIKPLLDEMFTCIRFIPNPAKPEVTRGLIEDDIEEVSTRLKLREEVLGLHLNFFKPAVAWILTAVRMRLQPSPPESNLPNTSTSAPTSES